MIQELGIKGCSVITRLSFLIDNDFPFTNFTSEQKILLSGAIKEAIGGINLSFMANNLLIQKVDLTTYYDGVVGTKKGTEIWLVDHCSILPNDLYSSISNIFGINLTKNPPTIGFGLLRRSVTTNGHGFQGGINPASHSSTLNLIHFDIVTFEQLGKDTLCLKLIHELLHSIGFNEEEVVSRERETYELLKYQFNPYIEKVLYPMLLESKSIFFKRIGQVLSNNELSWHMDALYNISEASYLNGFPMPPNATVDIPITDPITGSAFNILLF